MLLENQLSIVVAVCIKLPYLFVIHNVYFADLGSWQICQGIWRPALYVWKGIKVKTECIWKSMSQQGQKWTDVHASLLDAWDFSRRLDIAKDWCHGGRDRSRASLARNDRLSWIDWCRCIQSTLPRSSIPGDSNLSCWRCMDSISIGCA